jgi:tripartite-type tricarboxylate transporter receptor subunit TctC
MKTRIPWLLTTVLVVASLGAQAQSESGKLLRLVVSTGTGTAVDVRARWLADRLTGVVKQTIVVDNRPGAAGNLSAAAVARAPADGNTLLVAHQGLLAVNPHLFARPGFDALVDLVPVARLGVGPLVLVAGPQTSVRSLPELVQLAKAKPGALSYASPVIGSPPFVAAELMKSMAGIDVLHVPFMNVAITQTIGGQVAFTLDNAAVVLPHIQSGRLRALAVTGRQRLASLPDVPTFAEAGLPGYEYYGWMGVVAPAGTPADVVQRLNHQISAILATEEARAWFAVQGVEPGDQSAEAFAAFVRDEYAQAGRLIRRLGLRVE